MLNSKKPLTISKPIQSSINVPNSAVKAMKNKLSKVVESSEMGSRTSIPQLPAHYDYMFAMPEEAVTSREQTMSAFLNNEGIFQIHLDAFLKQYSPE